MVHLTDEWDLKLVAYAADLVSSRFCFLTGVAAAVFCCSCDCALASRFGSMMIAGDGVNLVRRVQERNLAGTRVGSKNYGER